MHEGELHLSDVLERIKISSDRKAIEDLKHIFSHNRTSLTLNSLRDKVWHSVCEALFQCVTSERPKWLRPKSQISKTRSATRLEELAVALRVVVDAGVRKFRAKTVNAILDHIVHTLDASHQYCVPVSLDYLKCLTTVLGHQPHTEHLRDKWAELIEFVLHQIDRILNARTADSATSRASTPQIELPSRSPRPSNRASVSSSGRPKSSALGFEEDRRTTLPQEGGKELEELIICVRHLVCATNADVIPRAQQIISAVIEFLLSARSVARAHQVAFVILAEVLGRVNSTSVQLTNRTALQLVQIIRDQWPAKNSTFKNEMLAILVLIQDFITAGLLRLDAEQSDFRTSIRALVDTWYLELSGRPVGQLLQLEDVVLSAFVTQEQLTFFQTSTLRLRESSDRAEALWAVPRLAASFSASIDFSESSSRTDLGDEALHKKPRLSTCLDDLLDRAALDKGSAQISALQVLIFLVHVSTINLNALRSLVHRLELLLVHRDPHKAVSQPGTSRAGAHLLTLLRGILNPVHRDGKPTIQRTLPLANIEEPASLSEAACEFWSSMWQSRLSGDRQNRVRLAERAIDWLFKVWMPSNFESQAYAVQVLSVTTVRDLLFFMNHLTGGPYRPQPLLLSLQTSALIGQASEKVARDKAMIEYLLLLQKPYRTSSPLDSGQGSSNVMLLSHESNETLRQRLISSLTAETRKAVDAWQETLRDRPHVISIHMTRLLAMLAAVDHAVCNSSGEQDLRIVELSAINSTLMTMLVEFSNTTIKGRLHCNAIRDVLSQWLPACQAILSREKHKLIDRSELSPMLFTLSQPLSQIHRSASTYDADSDLSNDEEDANEPNGQRRLGMDPRGRDLPREVISICNTESSREISLNGYLQIYKTVRSFHDVQTQDTQMMKDLVAYLTGLTPDDICSSISLIEEVVTQSPPVDLDDLELLIEHLATVFLRAYDFERHEVAQTIILQTLHSYSHVWSVPDSGSLHDTAVEVYTWFVDTALKAGVCSRHVKLKISRLLMKILKERGPHFAPNASASIRTILFGRLNDPDLNVVFYVARELQPLFTHYVLGEHEAVFNELQDALPSDATSLEGMATRLYALSRLGSGWQTLLRRCSYHIFEIAGIIPAYQAYASHCMLSISKAYALSSPREIFALFGPQMIFTWSQHQGLQQISFEVFSYASLSALLADCEGEAYAQSMMTAKTNETNYLCSLLSTTSKDLIARHFGRTAAYCVAQDVDSSTSSAPSSRHEETLRDMIGKEKYKDNMKQSLPQTIGITLIAFEENVDAILKQLEKRSGSRRSIEALREMVQGINTSKQLPGDTQPVFRVNRLLDRIERLCRRADTPVADVWTPPVYTFVLRMLLDRVHPALGPLQACATVRKIRVLIALSGPVACSGYPLEMALHALRPFVSNQQSVDETIGVLRFLLRNGMDHLASNLEFTTGFVVCLLLKTRSFLRAEIEKTTQESEHEDSRNHVKEFRDFISHEWLEAITKKAASRHTQRQTDAFRSFISAAAGVLDDGNARQGSPESRLLYLCLEDQRSRRRILKGLAHQAVMSLLSAGFEPPTDATADIFGSQDLATSYAQVVRQTCTFPMMSEGYLIWASKVVGRAYMSSGLSSTDATHRAERHSRQSRSSEDIPSDLGDESQRTVLQSMLSVLSSSRPSECGLAENAIRDYLNPSLPHSDSSHRSHNLLPPQIIQAFTLPIPTDPRRRKSPNLTGLQEALSLDRLDSEDFILRVTLALTSHHTTVSPLLQSIQNLLASIPEMSHGLFGPILHLTLLQEHGRSTRIKDLLSRAIGQLLRNRSSKAIRAIRVVITAVFYLQRQIIPNETSIVDRQHWLDFDRILAAEAAAECELYSASLMFLEQRMVDIPAENRRSSRSIAPISPEPSTGLLLRLYREIDEPDSFYGVKQQPSLQSVISRLDYEGSTVRSLSFRGSIMDSEIRLNGHADSSSAHSMLLTMTNLNMSNITSALLSSSYGTGKDLEQDSDAIFKTAMKLEQWDMDVSAHPSSNISLQYEVLQAINLAQNKAHLQASVRSALLKPVASLKTLVVNSKAARSVSALLGILTEIDDLISFDGEDAIREYWRTTEKRSAWMKAADMASVIIITNARERLLSSMSRSESLQRLLSVTPRAARELEIQNLLLKCKTLKQLDASNEVLAAAVHLSHLAPSSTELGLNIDTHARYQMADVLWDQEESVMAIRLLQEIEHDTIRQKDNSVPRARLLALLGHHSAEARAANPDEIMDLYLRPAIRELHGKFDSIDAGHVTYEFAAFCDNQLRDPDLLAEFARAKRVRQNRSAELEEYSASMKAMKAGAARERVRKDYKRAGIWYKLDDNEYQRLVAIRESFVTQALENYLLSLAACDQFDLSVLRFFALWLEHDANESAVSAVGRHISKVPSHKFILLMNQLSSRLQSSETEFQNQLFKLLSRMCVDHPYHTMHHIFAGTHPSSGVKDAMAASREAAIAKLASVLKTDKKASKTWLAVYRADNIYHKLAMWKDQNLRTGKTYSIDSHAPSMGLLTVKDLSVPPATVNVALRPDGDYTKVPRIAGWKPTLSIANGLSQPKIVSAVGTDGQYYKQLMKGGNDDLRQDAIMEQVFDQVSDLLRNQTATRQRNLHVRTYKVLPLSASSGIMEFVQNTTALMDYLQPAHAQYFPKDHKWSLCRNMIHEVNEKSVETRTKVFRDVCKHFQPVMRYFFFERFQDPDDWFAKRLAYTRSTATISILGHVLGLGDRHCHNILLDEKSGEIVHIDLGVAFEAGRVLPIPEVVPFRLTRDLVDAMGINKVEGVFRRCCEFTLEALRQERGSIMTLLNVLRYDPLYSWSVSPLRAKRMQESNLEGNLPAGTAGDDKIGNDFQTKARSDLDDEGEAARALSVVEKKLSKTLSAAAAVNELIQQATDERNLALLYCGWSAWA